MISIQTNVNSLVAQQNLSVNSSFQSKTIQQLTSGYRINQSGDDAAGLAVANKFRSTVAELTQGVANGNDATAQLQIMDGGMSNISLILDRLKTLATQSASGTFTGNRTVLNSEFQNALSEIDRQAQSIGLNTGGLFAKNLDVFLGAGSGSSSLQNGIVTLGLTQSAVDSQSLGMRGMLAVNLTSGSLSGTNSGIDIGSTSATSVQNIVGNVTGDNPNQQAIAGYAALQFSGAGFSDAGKVSVSVNLAGVTDVATLATAVNSAIQSAGNGTTASATAFKNANVVASLHTDSSGGQQLAFSSGTAAFQVQAGDQMANALLGNVAVVGGVGGVAKGTAISGTSATTVTGATTKAGNFSAVQQVKLVVTGGGLAGPVTLKVNTTSLVSTTGAITDLENQFSGSAALQAAGLNMSGSSTVGGRLSFNSASGQGFNIQVTGDSANLLGLGSFLADSAGNADYTTITAGTAYSAATVTGSATTSGLASGLEISLNGQGSTALTPVDLTAGAHAVAASLTSNASVSGVAPGNSAGTVDITAANNKLNVTVINNGTATNATVTLDTNGIASKGAATSSVMGNGAGAIVISSATTALNNSFMVTVDGGTAVKVTLTAKSYATRGEFLTEVQDRISESNLGSTVTAAYADGAAPGDGLGALTLTSAKGAGVDSTVMVGVATTATQGTIAAGSLASDNASLAAGTYTVSSALHNDKFMVSKDGATAVEVTIAARTDYDATTFLAAVTAGGNGMPAGVTASWDALNGNKLTLTSNTVASSTQVSSVAVTAATYASKGTVTSSAASLTRAGFTAYDSTIAGHDNQFTVAVEGGPAQTVTLTGNFAGTTDGADLFMTALQGALAGKGVTADWGVGGELTITSNATGHLSSVALGVATYATTAVKASGLLGSTIAGSPINVVTGTNDTFDVSVNGGASLTVTVGPTSTVDKDVLLGLIQTGLNAQFTAGPGGTHVTATWAGGTGALTLTTDATGDTASISVSATAGGNTGFAGFGFSGAVVARGGDTAGNNAGLTTIRLNASKTLASGLDAAVNGGLVAFTLDAAGVANGNATHSNAGLATMGLSGIAGVTQVGAKDGAASVESIAFRIQSALGIDNALVTVSNDYRISIASKTKGANSSVMLNNTANSAYATLHLTVPDAVLGLNSSIADVVDNLNAQFAANSTYQAAGLQASTGTDGNHVTIQSNNDTQFRLNAVGVAAAATAATQSSTVTDASFSVATPLLVTLNTNDKIDVSVNGLVAQTIQVAASSYTTSGDFLSAVQLAIANSIDPTNGLAGKVTAGWDTATRKLTLTSVATGTAAAVTTSATSGNTGIGKLGFGTGGTNSGQLFSATENTGFGVAGTTFAGAAASSTGTAMSAVDAFGISNSQAFTFSAMKYGNDKQALTFSATDANGVLETKTITLQNDAAINRAGVSIDDAVAYINTQLQQSTSQPALQKIVAVKEKVGSQENINFVSSLSGFTVGVAATANADGLNGGAATYRTSVSNGDGANMQVDSKEAAKAAVSAIATAIGKLGSAQAAVGKGQNQLYYAVNLAQSQITNFSAAESYLRDANVAQQAANLTKAQVLSQASIAAMAQANSAPQAILALLRG